MKYYLYLSEPKIQMLHAQISVGTERKREASIGFDLKVLKGQVKESRALPETAIPKLLEVIQQLQRSDLVGTIEDPKQYIGGTLQMKWATYGDELFPGDQRSPITFWGHCQNVKYPHEGTVMAPQVRHRSTRTWDARP